MDLTIEDFLEKLSEAIGKCPKCGSKYKILAVFEDDKSDDILGFKLLCKCNTKEKMTPEYLASLKLYTMEELINMNL